MKKVWDILIGWSFTAWGVATWNVVGAGIMLGLTYMTTYLEPYAPLSYGIAAFLGMTSIMILLRLVLSIWISFSQRLTTKKPTFIEYKISSRRTNLFKKSNIYQEPSCVLLDSKQADEPNRSQRRLDKSSPKSSPQVDDALSIQVMTLFEKPIASSSMHLRVESISGRCPTIETSSNNERWARVVLCNIQDGCYFRIWFNDIEIKK